MGYKCDSTATWAGELHGRNVIVILDSPGTYVLVFLQGLSTGPQDVRATDEVDHRSTRFCM